MKNPLKNLYTLSAKERPLTDAEKEQKLLQLSSKLSGYSEPQYKSLVELSQQLNILNELKQYSVECDTNQIEIPMTGGKISTISISENGINISIKTNI